MPKTRLKTAFMTHGHTAALKDGRVSLPDYEFDFEEVLPIPKAFRRMVISGDFEVSEMAMTTLSLCQGAGGEDDGPTDLSDARVPSPGDCCAA